MRLGLFVANFLYFIFFLAMLLGIIPPMTSIEDYLLYGQNFISINMSLPEELSYLPMGIAFLTSISLAIYSSLTKNNIDRVILFSRKGFLINATLLMLIFIVIFVGANDSNTIKENFTEETFNYYKEKNKDKIVMPLSLNESKKSFAKRLNNATKEEINIKYDKWGDECQWFSNATERSSLDFFADGLLIINKDQIQETIETYNQVHKIDLQRCVYAKERWDRRAKEDNLNRNQKELRDQADRICDAANNTLNGC